MNTATMNLQLSDLTSAELDALEGGWTENQCIGMATLAGMYIGGGLGFGLAGLAGAWTGAQVGGALGGAAGLIMCSMH